MFSLQSNGLPDFESLNLVRDIIADFAQLLPYLLKALLIFIIGWIVAKIAAKITKKILKAIRIDRFGDKLSQIEFVSNSRIPFVLSSLMSKFVYWTLMLIFSMVAVDVLQVEALTSMMKDLISFIPKLVSAFAMLVIGLLLSEAFRKLLYTTLKSLAIPSYSMISKSIFYFLLVNVFIASIDHAGINVDFISSNLTVLIGGIALAFAIAYGFASKSIAASTLSAFYAKDEIKEGDVITVDGNTGRIQEIKNQKIVLVTQEGIVLIPFSKVMEQSMIIHND